MKAALFRALIAAFALSLFAAPATAQKWPAKPIHIVVPYPAGGIADKIAREVAEELRKRLDQNVIVENRAGAAGNIGFEWVSRQPGDGYTLLLAPASNLTVQPALFKTLPYSLEKDFTAVSLLVQTPQVLLVHPSMTVGNVKDLVAWSQSHPGKTNFGVSLGSYAHLAGEMLKFRSGADFAAVSYQGVAPAVNDLVGGQTQFMFNEVMTSLQYVQGGRLKPLAVAYRTRIPWLPDVPTMAEAGFADFEVTSWYAMVAPAATPRPIVEQVSRELAAIVRSPEFAKRYADLGAYTVGSTPQELESFIRSESARWIPIVKQANIPQN